MLSRSLEWQKGSSPRESPQGPVFMPTVENQIFACTPEIMTWTSSILYGHQCRAMRPSGVQPHAADEKAHGNVHKFPEIESPCTAPRTLG